MITRSEAKKTIVQLFKYGVIGVMNTKQNEEVADGNKTV